MKPYITILLFHHALFSLPIQSTYSLADSQGIPLDRKLLSFLNYENGYFIEVRAHDGITQSNTKVLEEAYNWKGILIEPSENLFHDLCKNRPNSLCFNCALGSFEENSSFAYGDFNGGLMASLTGREPNNIKYRVLIRSLQSILDEIGIVHINFFSLDTEGYELNILKGIDFNKTTFDYLLIEIYDTHFNDIVRLLSEKGYSLICNFSNYNKKSNPIWDGTHNDFLFKRKNLT
jgi:FkbM family methyltransferase